MSVGAPIATLAWLRGRVARIEGLPFGSNPYGFRLDAPLALIWHAGWRRGGADDTSPVKHRAPLRTRPGRGHGALGPRSEWNEVEIRALALMASARWPGARMAEALERTDLAVRGQLKRRRAAGMAA